MKLDRSQWEFIKKALELTQAHQLVGTKWYEEYSVILEQIDKELADQD